MEYQKIVNLLDDTTNQLSKFRTRNCVEINDESRGTYNVSSQIKFRTSLIRSNLFSYSDVYIIVSETVTITGAAADDVAKRTDERDKGIMFKNCATFTDCICEINNTQIDNAKDINAVMPIYNLIKYRDNYSKTSGNL